MIFSPLSGKLAHLCKFIRNFRPVCEISLFVGIGPVCRTDPVCGSYVYKGSC